MSTPPASLFATACPCGSGQPYAACCGPLHRTARLPATPLETMRSRYAAFAAPDQPGTEAYLLATWHPRTRPDSAAADSALRWTGLEIHGHSTPEEEADGTGWVEFTARYETASGPGARHERSRFARRAGRWFYLDGEVG